MRIFKKNINLKIRYTSIGNKWFNVIYSRDLKDGFTISNREKTQLTPEKIEHNNPNTPTDQPKKIENQKKLPKTGNIVNIKLYERLLILSVILLLIINLLKNLEKN